MADAEAIAEEVGPVFSPLIEERPGLRTEIESRLYFAGKERDRARVKADEATAKIAALLPQARADGLSVRAIMDLTGLSRQGVYDLLAKSELAKSET